MCYNSSVTRIAPGMVVVKKSLLNLFKPFFEQMGHSQRYQTLGMDMSSKGSPALKGHSV